MARKSLWAVFIRHFCLALFSLLVPPLKAGPERAANEVLRPSAQRNGLLQQVVTCLERGRLGRVWAGTRNGPFVYNGRRWTRHDPNPNFSSSFFASLLFEQGPNGQGWLWAGTLGNGIARLDLAHPAEGWMESSTRSRVHLVDNMARAIARVRSTSDSPMGLWPWCKRSWKAEMPIPAPVLERALLFAKDFSLGEGAQLNHRQNQFNISLKKPAHHQGTKKKKMTGRPVLWFSFSP